MDQYKVFGMWLRIAGLIKEAKKGFPCDIWEGIY